MQKVTKTPSSEKSPFNTFAHAYDAWFDSEGGLVFATEVEGFKEILPLFTKPWLEVGVGSGRFAQALGIDIGIDPSIGLLKMARKRGIKAHLARGEEKFFDKETFGTVFLIVTLCFVDAPLAVLNEANRILKREGKVVLGLVLRDNPWGQFYLAKKKQGHRFYERANFYSYDEVIGFLERAGFNPEKVVSTLFQKPEEVKDVEMPRKGFFPDAGFTILVAQKAA